MKQQLDTRQDVIIKLSESIKTFEKTHSKYLNSDGSLNRDGYKILMSAYWNEGKDKWYSYEIFHMGPRLKKYWNNPTSDTEYKDAWNVLYEKSKKKLRKIISKSGLGFSTCPHCYGISFELVLSKSTKIPLTCNKCGKTTKHDELLFTRGIKN